MRCKVDAGLPTEAVLLAMRDLLYLVQRSLDHPFGCRRGRLPPRKLLTEWSQ